MGLDNIKDKSVTVEEIGVYKPTTNSIENVTVSLKDYKTIKNQDFIVESSETTTQNFDSEQFPLYVCNNLQKDLDISLIAILLLQSSEAFYKGVISLLSLDYILPAIYLDETQLLVIDSFIKDQNKLVDSDCTDDVVMQSVNLENYEIEEEEDISDVINKKDNEKEKVIVISEDEVIINKDKSEILDGKVRLRDIYNCDKNETILSMKKDLSLLLLNINLEYLEKIGKKFIKFDPLLIGDKLCSRCKVNCIFKKTTFVCYTCYTKQMLRIFFDDVLLESLKFEYLIKFQEEIIKFLHKYLINFDQDKLFQCERICSSYNCFKHAIGYENAYGAQCLKHYLTINFSNSTIPLFNFRNKQENLKHDDKNIQKLLKNIGCNQDYFGETNEKCTSCKYCKNNACFIWDYDVRKKQLYKKYSKKCMPKFIKDIENSILRKLNGIKKMTKSQKKTKYAFYKHKLATFEIEHKDFKDYNFYKRKITYFKRLMTEITK